MLYPGDDSQAGQELRLRQEYFFASASLQDMIRRHVVEHGTIGNLPDYVAIQLNDTHPAIGIAELMRLLLDNYGLDWDEAWTITKACFSYTNHTLLPEALEMWPVLLLERLLPRHMQIIYLLNARHLDRQRAGGADDRLLAALSLVDESNGRRVRMGHLAFLGSHSVNGVSALHTELMRRTTFRDLDTAMGGQIVNRTNGITFRRWLHQTNPGLTRLLVETVGERVLADPAALADLAPHAEDAGFRDAFQAQRRVRKEAMVRLAAAQTGIQINPDALFDVQIKRIHEYKRQLMNILHAISQYNAIRAQPTRDWRPRVKFFAGKAAPSYVLAKQIIRLAHDVAKVVNEDPTVRGLLQVVFMPNYNVSLAEMLIPAADLSEQISTAGMEASGTGNMKLALNGALTIGTLDGANVEICERVGPGNMFIFGMTAEEVEARRLGTGLAATIAVDACPALRAVLDALRSGVFSPEEPARYFGLADRLEFADPFFTCADFASYDHAQEEVDAKWQDQAAWWQSAVLNTANMAWFSSDRTIAEYASGTWRVSGMGDRGQT